MKSSAALLSSLVCDSSMVAAALGFAFIRSITSSSTAQLRLTDLGLGPGEEAVAAEETLLPVRVAQDRGSTPRLGLRQRRPERADRGEPLR